MGTDNNLTSFEQDIYNRKIIAANLTKIIDAQTTSLVMSIDSAWGTGKTTFITMWKDLLDSDVNYNTRFKTLYFNAWEHDYTKDPLLSIFCEIEAQIKEDDDELKKKLDSAKSKLKSVAKFTAKSGLKLATAGVLDLDKIDFGEQTEEQILGIINQLGDISVKEVCDNKKLREDFKKEMSDYQKKCEKKIIFFIDELDRCRPTFAIELLEVIKHLFDIENFVFVISIDKEQLSHSVSTVYGQGMDTMGYLRRFFDLDYKLPNVDIRKYIDNKNQAIFKNNINVDIFKLFLKEMFINEHFSLRDIDKAYYYIKILVPLIDVFNKEERWNKVYVAVISYLYSILIVTKLKNTIVYKNIIIKNYIVEEIINEFTEIELDEDGSHIGGYHPEVLNELIKPVLEKYLKLNLVAEKGKTIYNIDENQYTIGITGQGGFYSYGDRYKLTKLFKDGESSIHNNLEFIEGF